MHGDTPVYLQQVLNGLQVDQNNYILRNEHDIPELGQRLQHFWIYIFHRQFRIRIIYQTILRNQVLLKYSYPNSMLIWLRYQNGTFVGTGMLPLNTQN